MAAILQPVELADEAKSAEDASCLFVDYLELVEKLKFHRRLTDSWKFRSEKEEWSMARS
jgi:hypothetical protein